LTLVGWTAKPRPLTKETPVADIAQPNNRLTDIAAAGDGGARSRARRGTGQKRLGVGMLRTLGAPPDERKLQGAHQRLKDRVTGALAGRREALKRASLDARLNTETVDVRRRRESPPRPAASIRSARWWMSSPRSSPTWASRSPRKTRHRDRRSQLTKLNIPEGHPAREMHDAFFFNPKPDGSRLLLPTSPVQIRT
jgi:phenylalanyl-tRNA synthetase alpha chain